MLSTSPTAVLFPGQGSQTPDMRDVVADVRPDLLRAVIDLVGEDPFPLVDRSTRYAQPAIFCASLAGWTQVRDRVDPIALAGHSLGELTALAAAGAIDDFDALALVVLRGLLMDVAGAASGGGTMLAVLGATPAQAAALASRHRVSLANDNAPGQVVLSGAPDKLKAARDDARGSGLRAVALDVTGAFHSPQMRARSSRSARRSPRSTSAPGHPGHLLRDRRALRRPARRACRRTRLPGALARDDGRARRGRREHVRRRRPGRGARQARAALPAGRGRVIARRPALSAPTRTRLDPEKKGPLHMATTATPQSIEETVIESLVTFGADADADQPRRDARGRSTSTRSTSSS